MTDKILHSVYAAIDQVNSLLPKGEKVEKSRETALVGNGGILDSLGLVNLVVALETQIQSDFSQAVSLVDVASLAPEESPFRTVATLVTYLERLLESRND